MVKCFNDEEATKASDGKLKRFDTAHEYNSYSKIIKGRMEGNLVVSDRELIMFWTNQTLSDDSRVIIAFSIETDKTTSDASAVRGSVNHWTFHIEEVSDEKCKVTAVNHVDPGGSIPTMFINTMVGLRHTQFVKFKKLAESA